MNKVMAELIAGLIPVKMQRNRWRGILRYGALNAIRLNRRLRKPAKSPDVFLSVCAIAKDEGPYFKEWIEWHRKIGVEKFYIYDNGSSDNTREVLEPYINAGIVEYITYPGYRMQIAAYDDCMERHRFDTRWLAFIDLDEFIVPVADGSLTEFLKRFGEAPGVEINWLIYGSGGNVEKSSQPVMCRFKRHSKGDNRLNRHVKSIVQPRRVYAMIGCHEAACISRFAVDSHGDEVTRNFREREPQHDVIRINHYAVRSLQEFKEKCLRGRASGRRKYIDMEYFNKYDLNDEADTD